MGFRRLILVGVFTGIYVRKLRDLIINFFKSSPENWYSNIASLASIISLILSGIVLYQVKNIKKYFLKKIRFPEIEKELRNKTSKLSKTIPNWDTDKHYVLETASEIKAILKNINSKYDDKEIKNCIKKTLKDLEGKKDKHFFSRKQLSHLNTDELWDVYSNIVEIQTILTQTIKDMKWENNG